MKEKKRMRKTKTKMSSEDSDMQNRSNDILYNYGRESCAKCSARKTTSRQDSKSSSSGSKCVLQVMPVTDA